MPGDFWRAGLGFHCAGGGFREAAERAHHDDGPAVRRRHERAGQQVGPDAQPRFACCQRRLFQAFVHFLPAVQPLARSLHTGRPPHELGVDRNNMAIDEGIPISGQLFRAAGYDTGYAGKWHVPEVYPSDGIAGFESLNTATRKNKLAVDVDEATKDAAVGFLRRKREKPFLLVVSFINPHDICLPAGGSELLDELWKRYQPASGAELPPLPANFDHTAGEPTTLAARAVTKTGTKPSGGSTATPTIA